MSDSRYHFTQGTMGMPDLNTQDKRVQMMVANYLDELIDCGVDGFRFDAAKHIETPDDDAEFAGDFWTTVLNEARAHCKKTTGNDLYVYGEILNTVGLDFSIDSYTKYMSVTDNSADTLVNDQDGNFKGNLKNTLKQAKMGNCETYVWASKEAAAINHFNNRFHNDADDMGADGNKAYCRRGNGIVIVNFDGPGYVSMSAHGMSDGSYVDEVSGNKFVVEQGQLFGEITSEYGIAVVYQNVMSNPSENYPVQISVDKGDGTKFYGDSLDVVATAKYATTDTYKLSTGETGKVGDNTVINLGNGLKKGETVTLTITASNKSGEKTESYTYVKDEYDLTNCIFFKNTNGWSAVTAYIWSEGGKTSVKNAGWPGEQMYECDPVNHIFALKIDDSLGYTNIIFSNNGASQTKDIAIGQVGYMYNPSTNEWTQYKNQPVKKFPTVSATKDSQTFKDSIEVTYTVNNAIKATITIDGKSEEFTGSITKKFTERTVVDITALNNDGETTKSYVYTKVYDEAIVNITEDCTFTTDTMDVEINVFNADKAYYQIDGGNKVVVPVEERTIYFNASKCSWFANDKAVAAIRTEDSTAFVKMNAIINNAGETVNTFDIPKKSSMVTIGRMLPSGNVYNEKVITLDATKDYYLSDSNWSNVYAYTWGSSKKSVQWPGQKMTLAGTNQYGEKVYKITVPTDVKGLIFTNGNGAQTADITKGINENAGFYISGNGAKANVGTYTFSKSQLK